MKPTISLLTAAVMTGCLSLVANVAAADSTYAEDWAEIENLQARYMFGLAFRDPEEAEQQRVDDTSGLRPAAGRHNISNVVIEIDGDRATATAYWFHMGNDNPERTAQLNSFGHYEDELKKVDGEWLFSLRKIYNEQVAEWAAGQQNPVVHPSEGPRLRQSQ
jgi:hypothetical protein